MNFLIFFFHHLICHKIHSVRCHPALNPHGQKCPGPQRRTTPSGPHGHLRLNSDATYFKTSGFLRDGPKSHNPTNTFQRRFILKGELGGRGGQRLCVSTFSCNSLSPPNNLFSSKRPCKSSRFSPPPLLPAWGKPPSPPTCSAPTAFFRSSSSPLLWFIFQIAQSELFLKCRPGCVIMLLPKTFYLPNGLPARTQ